MDSGEEKDGEVSKEIVLLSASPEEKLYFPEESVSTESRRKWIHTKPGVRGQWSHTKPGERGQWSHTTPGSEHQDASLQFTYYMYFICMIFISLLLLIYCSGIIYSFCLLKKDESSLHSEAFLLVPSIDLNW